MSIKDITDIKDFENVKRILGIKIDLLIMTARADVASAPVAQKLHVEPNNALIFTKMTYLSDSKRTVEVSITKTPSHYFVLSFEIAMNNP